MHIYTELDLIEPFTSVIVEVVAGSLLAFGAFVWGLLRWRVNKRRELTVPDRHTFSLVLGAAARQVEMLDLYDRQLGESADLDKLWPKIQQCLDNLLDYGHGPGAKIATGNAASGFSKSEGRVAMLMIGTISNLAMSYGRTLPGRIASEGDNSRVHPCRLELLLWADHLRFAQKVFDPTRKTLAGISRLERNLRKRLLAANRDVIAAGFPRSSYSRSSQMQE